MWGVSSGIKCGNGFVSISHFLKFCKTKEKQQREPEENREEICESQSLQFKLCTLLTFNQFQLWKPKLLFLFFFSIIVLIQKTCDGRVWGGRTSVTLSNGNMWLLIVDMVVSLPGISSSFSFPHGKLSCEFSSNITSFFEMFPYSFLSVCTSATSVSLWPHERLPSSFVHGVSTRE